MKYDQPQLQEKLAAEYVLGTLSGAARRRFVRLLTKDRNLRAAVAAWEERLAPLAEGVGPVEPPSYVWDRIAAQLGIAQAPARKPAPRKPGLLESLGFWRAFAGFATATAFGLLIYVGTLGRPEQVPTVTLAILTDAAAKPLMVITAEPVSHTVSITPLGKEAIPADRDYELWALPEGAAPKSLGVINATKATYIKVSDPVAALIRRSKTMAVSLEPKGGSPTGAPTGPIVLQGARI